MSFGGVSVEAARNDEDRRAIENRVATLLAQPLNAESAVQVALLNNRGLQATLAELGVADAELLEASRPPNPGRPISRPRSGANLEIEHRCTISLARLLVLPLLKRTEEARFEQTRNGSRRGSADTGLGDTQGTVPGSCCHRVGTLPSRR